MKATFKEMLILWMGLIGFFLALEHFTGFSKDVGSLFTGAEGFTRALQGQ